MSDAQAHAALKPVHGVGEGLHARELKRRCGVAKNRTRGLYANDPEIETSEEANPHGPLFVRVKD
jgi:hypothetical protein